VSSFTVGIKTAGDITPIKLIEAGSVDKPGDINGNGEIDIRDVIDILEISQGYRDATTEELRVDPNGDGALTVDDALWILSTLAIRSDAS
jgi:hypothetical protein